MNVAQSAHKPGPGDRQQDDEEPLRIFLIDDSSLVRAGLAQTFREYDGLRLVGSTREESAALEACLDASLDAVVINAACRSIDVSQLLREAAHHTKNGASKILLLTGEVEDVVCSEAKEAGVGGIVSTWEPPQILVSALRIVARGYRVSVPNNGRRQREEYRKQHAEPGVLGQLTLREREVLTLMAQGLRNAEIAAELVISESTVKTHVQNLLVKLGLRNRASAVALAYKVGITRSRGAGDR
ncbi:response regulator transcription factor [Microbispora amethystogenes]|uniref:response regulator transcription factor n=1 Tax=Microbispora amethystogenes TaxID=1427754 RepID=UPI003402CA28